MYHHRQNISMNIGGGRVLQLGVPKIYSGSSSTPSILILGGSGGMPPRNILKIRCQEIKFGGIFGGFSC